MSDDPVPLPVHARRVVDGDREMRSVVLHVHRIPIVTDNSRVVGLVSTLDITRWRARQAGYEV
jgi:CBS domain-containing protein